MKKLIFAGTAAISAAAFISVIWLTPTASSQSHESKLPQSKLGVRGEMGFIIQVIDSGSPLEQAGLRVGDIITNLNGQVTSIEKFQKDVATSAPGTIFKVLYLRFDHATGKFEEQSTTVKTVPFASSTEASIEKISMITVKGSASLNHTCPGGCCVNC